MSFLHFIKLVLGNLRWLLILPTVLAGTIYYFTRGEKKEYSSESIIYTGIASGYSLSGTIKADFYSTSNAFDNLLSLIESRETKEDVAIDLIAEHLVQKKPNPEIISWEAYENLKNLIPIDVRKKIVRRTKEETKLEIIKLMNSSEHNIILEILNSGGAYYSFAALNTIKPTRISNSDLIKVSYTTTDPGICKRTLELLEQSFMKKHRLLKEGQTESVVKYFEEETAKAFAKLDSSEKLFLDFNKKYEIINYYEQTKAIAGEREDLYAMNHNLEMDKLASTYSLDKVNENIKGRVYQSLYGSDIIKEREKLSNVYTKISAIEVVGDKSNVGQKMQLDSLKRVAVGFEKKLKTSLDNLYKQTNTPSGIPTKNVLDEWLKTTLSFEQSKARLAVMGKRKREFEEEYRKYAPLGAMLKKIERQIDVSEQAYLELLHGLSMARLTQQNTELTTKLNIVDPPYLPIKANTSKRMVQVILGFVVGFVLVLAFILSNALINKTLLEPQRARKIIDIPLLGLFPVLTEDPRFLKKGRLRLLQNLLSKVDLKEIPFTIAILSIEPGEGKSLFANQWKEELTKLNYEVDYQIWDYNTNYQPKKGCTIMIWELPAIDSLVIKPGFFPKMDLTVLVARSNRIWGRIDRELLQIFIKTTHNQPQLLLNAVDTNFSEEYIGEVPKKRSFLRRKLKQLVKFEFGNRKLLRK